jgi:micrococcal nuclease
MKKIVILLLLLFPYTIFANAKDNVSFYKCVDGDTARFILNKKEIKVRLIGIDAPESVKPNEKAEPYGKKASNYTCNKLKRAKKIVLEYEPKTEKKDKYGRVLAYVFVDDKLLEESIVKNGYAKVKYIKSDYKYYDKLNKAELTAINNKKGIYQDGEEKTEDLEKGLAKYIKKYCKKILSNILREIFK